MGSRPTSSEAVLLDLSNSLDQEGKSLAGRLGSSLMVGDHGSGTDVAKPFRSSGAVLVRCVCETKCLLRLCAPSMLGVLVSHRSFSRKGSHCFFIATALVDNAQARNSGAPLHCESAVGTHSSGSAWSCSTGFPVRIWP